MILCLSLLLCGCGGQNRAMQTALELRAALLERGCSFTAEIEAHPADGTAAFTLTCECRPDGTTELEVRLPESVAGIEATVQPDGQNVRFDDVGLDFGLLADGQLAPMAIPQLLYRCWTREYIREAGKDEENFSAVYLSGYGDRELAVEQCMSTDGTPLYADLWFGIENVANVRIRDFSLGDREETE